MYIPKIIRLILIFIMMLGTISVDVLIDNTFFIAENGIVVTNFGEVFTCVTFLLIVFFTFLLVTRVGVLSRENMEIELALQQSKLEHEFSKTIEVTMEELRETRHDIKNHLRTMQVLLARKNYLKLKDYFEKMNGEIDTLTDIVLTPDKILNSIIYSKMPIMKAENIKFIHCINDTSNRSVSEYDLCSILGNLLDNSIEACCKLDFSLRRVGLRIRRKENMLIINLSNSCNSEYKHNNNGKYITTKAEMGHGLGLRHIERILTNYHGHMQIKSTLNSFAVTIFLPCG